MEILSAGFGKSMILLCYGQRRNILIENLYDHNFPSTDDQMSEMLSLSCTAMDLMTKTVNLLRESPPQFFLLLGVRE